LITKRVKEKEKATLSIKASIAHNYVAHGNSVVEWSGLLLVPVKSAPKANSIFHE
jgi:hypothetical protein